MIRSLARLLPAFFLSLALANTALAESDFTVARGGEAACVIITGEDPGPSARLAALELQHHLHKITGAFIPVGTGGESGGARILVGDSAAAAELGFRSADLAPQEYVIAFRSNTLILLGNDEKSADSASEQFGRTTTGETLASLRHRIDYWKTVGLPGKSTGEMELPGLYDAQGTCYAVYDFLERFCGVRWYGPAAIGQILPQTADLTIAASDIRRAPALKHRSAMSRGGWPFVREQWGPCSDGEIYLYWRRMRLGGERWAGNHTIHQQTIRDLLNNPVYQAQGRAQGKNLCYTNPVLVETIAQLARDYFDGKGELPEGFKAMGDYFSLVPEDVSLYCRCDTCRDLLKKGRDRHTGLFSSGLISEYWFSFVNAVARELKKTHPDKYIATLAYWEYAFPPEGFNLEPNVSIAPCLHTCYYPNDAAVRENDLLLYSQWLKTNTAPMFMWIYYHHPMEPALINKWNCFPHVSIHTTAEYMKRFIGDGVRGMFQCGETDQLEQYLVMKLWDDPALDADAVIDEFFRLYFGAAAQPMQAFYLTLERIASDPANYASGRKWPSEEQAWEELGTPERMEALGALMAEAHRLAGSEEEKTRVSMWDKALWQWMLDGQTAWKNRDQ